MLLIHPVEFLLLQTACYFIKIPAVTLALQGWTPRYSGGASVSQKAQELRATLRLQFSCLPPEVILTNTSEPRAV